MNGASIRPAFSSNIIDHKITIGIKEKLYCWDLKKKQLIARSAPIQSISAFFLRMTSGHEVLYFDYITNNTLHLYNFITKSEADTISFAYNLASKLKTGDIIVLTGELGSGKTKFTQGILKYFGLDNEISSPTFTIVNEYHKNSTNIYHFDVYRLSDVDEFYAIGGDEYFSNGICIIEWGELISSALPKDYLHIVFSKDDENEDYRKLEIIPHGNRFANFDFAKILN